MGPIIGGLGGLVVIFVLFSFDHDDAKVTKAMWMPLAWLFICSSRPISNWLSLSQPGGAAAAYVDGSPLDRSVLTFLLAVGLIFLSRRMKQVEAILAVNPAILIFVAYCLISLLWSDYSFVGFKRWIRAIADIVVILLIVTEPKPMDAIKWLFKRIGFVLIPLSIVLIRFYPSLGRFYSRGGVPEWTGVCTDKNALGMLCMIYGTGLLWYGIGTYRSRGSKHRKQQLCATAITFVMILYLMHEADSKTALSCFLMSIALIVVTSIGPKFRRPAFVNAIVFGMLSVSFCVLFLGIGGGALSAMGRDSSLTGRTEVWATVLPYAKSAWFGAGYESFWVGERIELFARLLGGLNQAHNGYIEIYLNLGWVGLVLLGAIIVRGYRKILKELRNDRQAATLKLAFFVICLVYNFTEASFKMQSPVWIFFLWAVMSPSLRAGSKEPAAQFQNVEDFTDKHTLSGVPTWTEA